MYSPNVTGIVAEYNPLHLGHCHHICEARRLSCADAVIVVLSSDFVQRGEPAMLSKWERAQLALCAGADLVLELPVVFSSHNAGVFANAAVDIFHKLHAVKNLSFGLESTAWNINSIADILIYEPQPFKTLLKNFLDEGYSFVEARSKTLDAMEPGTARILRGSNNMLALSYVMRLKKINSEIKIFPVKRQGSAHNYNSTDKKFFASSSAIRQMMIDENYSDALSILPDVSAAMLRNELAAGHVFAKRDKLWDILRSMLLRATPEKISACAEVSEGIEYKLRDAAIACKTFNEWITACSSRRYPRGRIQRHAMHFMLGLDQWTNRAFQRLGPAYIRVLAMNENGQKLLRRIKKSSELPIITRCGDAARISDYAEKIMSFDILASELRQQMLPNPEPGFEHKRKVIIN